MVVRASGESTFATDQGFARARVFKRKPENGGRWSKDDFDKFVGAPWEPDPGAEGGCELRSKVRLATEPVEFTGLVNGQG